MNVYDLDPDEVGEFAHPEPGHDDGHSAVGDGATAAIRAVLALPLIRYG